MDENKNTEFSPAEEPEKTENTVADIGENAEIPSPEESPVAEVNEKDIEEAVIKAEESEKHPEAESQIPPFVPPYVPESYGIAPEAPAPAYPKAPESASHEFSHKGEYSYTPPYAPAPRASQEETQMHNVKKEKKEKVKTKKTFSAGAVALLLIGAIILSFASGMGGALLVVGGFELEDAEAGGKDKNDGEGLVVDRADEDEKDPEGSNTADGLVGDYDISDVCAVVSASVVEITTEFNQTYYGSYQYVQEGAGSGVIISQDGYVLTNAHVITNSENGKLADAIKIRLNSSKEYTAKIIGSDNDSDVALLKIDAKGLTAATVGNSDKIKVGEHIIAVGNPLGELGGTVTSGIVSATNREITVENNKMTLIQIDAAINPGNSGGGLFNLKGELIGIVNAKTTDVTVEGLGFAIPVNEAVSVAEELESHGYVTGKTYIGIGLADVTDSFTAYYYFRSQSTGVYVNNVQKGYNDNVLFYGDRITAIDDTEITSSSDVKEIVQACEVGDTLVFTVSREGKLVDVTVTCYEYVPAEGVSFDNE